MYSVNDIFVSYTRITANQTTSFVMSYMKLIQSFFIKQALSLLFEPFQFVETNAIFRKKLTKLLSDKSKMNDFSERIIILRRISKEVRIFCTNIFDIGFMSAFFGQLLQFHSSCSLFTGGNRQLPIGLSSTCCSLDVYFRDYLHPLNLQYLIRRESTFIEFLAQDVRTEIVHMNFNFEFKLFCQKFTVI